MVNMYTGIKKLPNIFFVLCINKYIYALEADISEFGG